MLIIILGVIIFLLGCLFIYALCKCSSDADKEMDRIMKKHDIYIN